MNIKEQHVVTGMTTDMNVSRFDPTKVLYARNIRITQMDGNQGLLCVTNEKGTKQCTVSGDTITGITVGSAKLNDYLVLFTHQGSVDHIYRLTVTGETSFESLKLFGGNLGLSEEHPLETLALYENDNIQKVYWVDGVHQLRCINIADTEGYVSQVSSTSGENTVFDANPVIDLSHIYSVEKRNSGGEFPAGTIQYAFTYYNLNGVETNVFETTPLYELSPQTKGVAADGRVNCSFRITLSLLDSNFDYVRVYAIVRTSANATPSVRIVGDYEVTERTMYIVDNGAIGETVDATKLLFVGGEPVAPSTFAVKDNTLFLGNITVKRPSLYNVLCNGSKVGDLIGQMRDAGKLPIINNRSSDHTVGSGDWFYDYTIDNNRPSTTLRRFKRGETYRLGIIAQHETGIWSDVVWIGDYENGIVPEFYSKVQSAGCFRLYRKIYGEDDTSISDILTSLEEAGFVRIAPVVVYPEGSDRTVFCQGLVSATVYNVEDRFSNRPFSQASWFFRPIAEGFGVAAIPHASLYPIKRNTYTPAQTLPDDWNPRPQPDGRTIPTDNDKVLGNAEIQINTNPRNFLPQVMGHWESGSDNIISSADMVAMFGNDYYVDTSIVTLNSPDIELDDSIQQEDLSGLKFRIVGVAKSSPQNLYQSIHTDISAGGSPDEGIIEREKTRFLYAGGGRVRMAGFPSFIGYMYYMVNTPGIITTFSMASVIMYPWQKTGRIPGNYNLTEQKEMSVLNHKVYSNIWFAHTELFDELTDIDEESIKLFDDTQSDFIPLGETADSSVYYGNIDTVRIFKKDYITNDGKTFTMQEPLLLENEAKFLSADRKPATTNKYPIVHGPTFGTGTSGADTTVTTIAAPIEDTLFKHGEDRDVPDGQEDKFLDDAPVPIRYKSTKHAVISLAHENTEIPSLYRCEAICNAYLNASGDPQDITVRPFWDDSQDYTLTPGKVPFASEWDSTFNYNRVWAGLKDSYKSLHSEIPTLYIGELYREVSASTRFGGTSQEAVCKNIWKRCGKAVCIAELTVSPPAGSSHVVTHPILFEEGDTYLARYDCLKTYPYADNDVNSIVEIFSTDLETRVNLDARYDNARALIDNTLVNPTNINLVNRLGFEQENNFFTHSAIDPERENIDHFPNLVSISTEKTLGEEVDSWMQHNLTSTQDLEGVYGEIEALKTFNNDVFVFQNNAFGQLLFNNRVQIPTSDGQPIEITNGMKLQGIRYLSNKIGCSNKWSIAISNSRMYWHDKGTEDLWVFGGQGFENLSTSLGVKGYVHTFPSGKWSVEDMDNLRTLHDEKYNDLYFIANDKALVYSETLNTFVSETDYADLEEMYNFDGNVYVVRKNDLQALWQGPYNSFFGEIKPYVLRFIANAQPTMHKVFDTVQWRSDTWKLGNGASFSDAFNDSFANDSESGYLPRETFNKLQVWNQYQKSEQVTLNDIPGKPSPLKKKFNTFRALVPRDKLGNSLTDKDYTYKKFSRIRGNYAVVELTHDLEDTNKMQFYDLEISEFI